MLVNCLRVKSMHIWIAANFFELVATIRTNRRVFTKANSVVHFQIFVLFTRLVTNLQSGQTNGFSPVWIRRCIFNCVRSYRLNVLSQSIRNSPDRRTAIYQCEFKDILSIATLKLVTIWTGKRLLISVNSEMSYQFATSKLVTNWTGKRLLASVNIDDEFATLKLVTIWTGKRLLISVNSEMSYQFATSKLVTNWTGKRLLASVNIDDEFATWNLSQTEQANGFSSVWIQRCLINSLLRNLSQTEQANGFSQCVYRRWIHYFETCHNLDRQTASRQCEYRRWIRYFETCHNLQANGFSPVWISAMNSLLWNLSQSGQANGFSPVWISTMNSLLWNLSQSAGKRLLANVNIGDEFTTLKLVTNLDRQTASRQCEYRRWIRYFETCHNLDRQTASRQCEYRRWIRYFETCHNLDRQRLLASVNIDDEFATLKLVTIWTGNGFSPVWISAMNSLLWNLSQSGQANGFSPLWILTMNYIKMRTLFIFLLPNYDRRTNIHSVTSTMHTTYTIKWATYVLRLNFMLQSCRAAWILNFRHFTSVNSTILIRDTIHIRDSPNGHFVRTNLLSLTIRRDDAHSNCDPVCERLKCHNQDRRTVFHQCKFYHDAWIIMCYHIVIITECVTYAMSNIEKRSRMQFYSHLGVKIISHVSSQVLKDLT